MRIQVTPKRSYAFSHIVTPTAGENQINVTVAERINIEPFTSGVLAVRVFSNNVADAADSLTVTIQEDGYTREDPSANFFGGDALATVVVNNETDSDPTLVTSAFSSAFSSLVKVIVSGNRGVGTGAHDTSAIEADLQIDLIVRNGGA